MLLVFIAVCGGVVGPVIVVVLAAVLMVIILKVQVLVCLILFGFTYLTHLQGCICSKHKYKTCTLTDTIQTVTGDLTNDHCGPGQ